MISYIFRVLANSPLVYITKCLYKLVLSRNVEAITVHQSAEKPRYRVAKFDHCNLRGFLTAKTCRNQSVHFSC